MKASFKCENCSTVTVISGEGPRHLGCQSCGCGDIKFDSDVIVSPISSKNPGDVFPSVMVKKGESFLGNHPLGRSWNLTFPIPTPVVEPTLIPRSTLPSDSVPVPSFPPAPVDKDPVKVIRRKKGKDDEGIHGKL